ncbi:redoxin domain-containing protein [Mucilaginibacter sp. HMF5004]|uniref:peroxiredoxin family protein n=1 Tax=Mucilaginibacter rivuli TaxID=2857527 RepID=UPI001C5F91CC|nr:redoxin domain-containing protein [Mucilaginibacter rivuli]MBW4890613.1 redoxin domain-containing protein [Mucilaginibacter rivuli]
MSSRSTFPQFDILEILLERDFEFKHYKTLRPAKTGFVIPGFSFAKDFGRWAQFANGSETRGPIFNNQLLNKPLVIAFYSHHWGKKGLEQLVHLNNIQREVKANGGNLVVISPERPQALADVAWEHSLSLNFYFDYNNSLSKQFGVYDEKRPVWNQFTGIDEDAPLLATYVLNTAKQITYQHIDWNFENNFSGEDVLSAIYEAGTYKNNLRSA